MMFSLYRYLFGNYCHISSAPCKPTVAGLESTEHQSLSLFAVVYFSLVPLLITVTCNFLIASIALNSATRHDQRCPQNAVSIVLLISWIFVFSILPFMARGFAQVNLVHPTSTQSNVHMSLWLCNVLILFSLDSIVIKGMMKMYIIEADRDQIGNNYYDPNWNIFD